MFDQANQMRQQLAGLMSRGGGGGVPAQSSNSGGFQDWQFTSPHGPAGPNPAVPHGVLPAVSPGAAPARGPGFDDSQFTGAHGVPFGLQPRGWG